MTLLPPPSGLIRRGWRIATAVEGALVQTTPRRLPYPATANCTARRETAIPFSRPFSSSTPFLKKRKIASPSNGNRDSAAAAADSPPASSPSAPSSSASTAKNVSPGQPNPEDPLDFSGVTSAYAASDAHFKAILQSVVHGGRFNPASLGALPVSVKADDGSGQVDSFPLGELAQIVPRSGRTISLLVNDRAYIKPIMSAVQASKEFNQQPQRAEDNELELLLKVELERKEELVRRIKDATQAWRDRVRQARAKHEKALKDWKKSGAVLPDVVKKADKELQKLQDKKMKDIDQDEAQTIKLLDRN